MLPSLPPGSSGVAKATTWLTLADAAMSALLPARAMGVQITRGLEAAELTSRRGVHFASVARIRASSWRSSKSRAAWPALT